MGFGLGVEGFEFGYKGLGCWVEGFPDEAIAA
jgi:hypothetical protein